MKKMCGLASELKSSPLIKDVTKKFKRKALGDIRILLFSTCFQFSTYLSKHTQTCACLTVDSGFLWEGRKTEKTMEEELLLLLLA